MEYGEQRVWSITDLHSDDKHVLVLNKIKEAQGQKPSVGCFQKSHSTLELDILSMLHICALFLNCVLGKLGRKTVLIRPFPCVYVYWFVHVHLCNWSLCAWTHACGGLYQISFQSVSTRFIWSRVSLWNWSLSCRWQLRKSHRSWYLLSSALRSQVHTTIPSFYLSTGIWTQVLILTE